jgi:hypothetical protein
VKKGEQFALPEVHEICLRVGFMVSAARYNGFDDGELTGTFRNVVSKLRRRTLGATSYIGASPCVQQRRFFSAITAAMSINVHCATAPEKQISVVSCHRLRPLVAVRRAVRGCEHTKPPHGRK